MKQIVDGWYKNVNRFEIPLIQHKVQEHNKVIHCQENVQRRIKLFDIIFFHYY